MIKIDFPPYDFKIAREGKIEKIFDRFRKMWCVLTPEEWVRQNVLNYLTIELKYPPSLMAIEKEIRFGELKKRCDIVVYNPTGEAWMIVECKEMNVPLGENVIKQALIYHVSLPVNYLMISNGSYTFCFKKSAGQFVSIEQMPVFGS